MEMIHLMRSIWMLVRLLNEQIGKQPIRYTLVEILLISFVFKEMPGIVKWQWTIWLLEETEIF